MFFTPWSHLPTERTHLWVHLRASASRQWQHRHPAGRRTPLPCPVLTAPSPGTVAAGLCAFLNHSSHRPPPTPLVHAGSAPDSLRRQRSSTVPTQGCQSGLCMCASGIDVWAPVWSVRTEVGHGAAGAWPPLPQEPGGDVVDGEQQHRR
jgi:hypothetical protein